MTKPVAKRSALSIDQLLAEAMERLTPINPDMLTEDNKIKVNLLPHEIGVPELDEYVPELNKYSTTHADSVSVNMKDTMVNRMRGTPPNINGQSGNSTIVTNVPPPPIKARIKHQVHNVLRVYTMFGEQPEFLDIMVQDFLKTTKIADNIAVNRRFKSLSPYTYLSDVQGVRWYTTLVYEEDQTEWDQAIP